MLNKFNKHNKFWLLLLLFPLLATASPDIQHWRSDNGARVYYVHAPELPMVDLRVVFDAGSAHDGEQPGLAALTLALLDQGAGGRDADTIAETLEGLGAQLSGGSLRDMAYLQLRSLDRRALLEPALQTFIDILAHPDFPEKAVERERGRTLTGLRYQQQSPGDIAARAFSRSLYGDHPYAHPSEGTLESVATLERDDLVAYHRRYYTAGNAVIAIVGSPGRAEAEAIAARIAAALPAGEAAPPPPAVKSLSEGSERRIEHPSSQTHLLVGQPGVRRGDADYFPLYVGNHILGGAGLGSRILDEVREKRGLSYSAYSYFAPMRVEGPFTLGLQTQNAKADEALAVLRATLSRFVEEGPTADELVAAKRNITGGFPLKVDSNRDIIDYIAMIGFYGLPLDYLARFNERVEAVTLEQIRDAFQRRIHPERMVVVRVGGAD